MLRAAFSNKALNRKMFFFSNLICIARQLVIHLKMRSVQQQRPSISKTDEDVEKIENSHEKIVSTKQELAD